MAKRKSFNSFKMWRSYVSLVLILLVSVLFFTVASAQTTTDIQQIATPEDIELAGVTPDSPFLWGLELAFNRLTEIFSEKARVAHALERLAEVKVMLSENNPEKAQKAIDKFDKSYNRLKERKAEVSEDKKLIDNLGQKIRAIASTKGALTQTQQESIKELIVEHRVNKQSNIAETKTETIALVATTSGGRGY